MPLTELLCYFVRVTRLAEFAMAYQAEYRQSPQSCPQFTVCLQLLGRLGYCSFPTILLYLVVVATQALTKVSLSAPTFDVIVPNHHTA